MTRCPSLFDFVRVQDSYEAVQEAMNALKSCGGKEEVRSTDAVLKSLQILALQ